MPHLGFKPLSPQNLDRIKCIAPRNIRNLSGQTCYTQEMPSLAGFKEQSKYSDFWAKFVGEIISEVTSTNKFISCNQS
jgi:hypothetical protein